MIFGIGRFDTRATLQQAARSADGGGGFSESWTALATFWIALEVTGGGETFAAERLESRNQYRVTLRRRTDIVPGMRLVTPAQSLAIREVLDAGPRSQAMTLLCEDAP